LNKENLRVVGRITKAFGIRGELKVHPEFVFEDFAKFSQFIVITPHAGLKILAPSEIRSGPGKSIIMKFDGIETRELAEKLSGLDLMVHSEELPETAKDEYYIEDLKGCKVFCSKEEIGEVTDFLFQGLQGSLIVKTIDHKEVLIPFVKRYIKSLDISAKQITICDFDELKEINP